MGSILASKWNIEDCDVQGAEPTEDKGGISSVALYPVGRTKSITHPHDTDYLHVYVENLEESTNYYYHQ